MPHTLDLHFLGRPRVIATAAIPVDGGVVLVDPGPSSCHAALVAGLAAHGHTMGDVRALLLTHIHFDHAGAAGTLAHAHPGLPVYVHEFGAKHLAQPEKLIASATRLYGADMDRLWGEFRAVPGEALRPLVGGETLAIGGRTFGVRYTPGHAVHHVSYRDEADGTAYVGDTAGIAVTSGYILPATPPPDIDLEAWSASLDAIEAWRPSRLFLTHFGAVADVPGHLAGYRAALARAAQSVRQVMDGDGDEGSQRDAWVAWLRQDVRAVLSEDDAQTVEAAAPFDQLWQGLARFWRKRAAAEAAGAGGPGAGRG